MEYQTIEVKREGALSWLTLNRPDALNAMNPPLVDELRHYFSALAQDRETRVVVMRGAGRGFCAGLDLARELADEMLATTPLGLRLTKECLNASLDAGSLEHAIAMEDRNQVICARSKDFREGIQAFLEKRPPHYVDA
jgi:enoyl-CoA hydratase/carnithine racemase